MKMVKTILYAILFSGILLFASSFVPSIYGPNTHAAEDVLKDIHHSYDSIQKDLKIQSPDLKEIVTLEDIKKNTSSLDIQKKAEEVLSKVVVDQSTTYSKEASEKLAIKLQEVYDHLMKDVSTQDILQIVKVGSLSTVIASELILLILGFIEKRRKSR